MDEKRSKKRAIILAGILQLVLLMMLYFLTVWRAPIPPNPEYGIELSFLQASVASSPSASSVQEQAEEAGESSDQQEEIQQPKEFDESKETKVSESAQELSHVESAEDTEVFDQSSPDVNNKVIEDQTESHSADAQPTQKEMTPEKGKKESFVSEDDNLNEETETKKPKTSDINGQALYPNQGSREAEQPSINEQGLMGYQGNNENAGSVEGASLNMAGWIWENKPNKKDGSGEEGKIVFQITVDDSGDLVGIKILNSNVTPAVVAFYEEQVRQLAFRKTRDYRPAALSKGSITFIIKTK